MVGSYSFIMRPLFLGVGGIGGLPNQLDPGAYAAHPPPMYVEPRAADGWIRQVGCSPPGGLLRWMIEVVRWLGL